MSATGREADTVVGRGAGTLLVDAGRGRGLIKFGDELSGLGCWTITCGNAILGGTSCCI